jgi:inward rectifier potassium channel
VVVTLEAFTGVLVTALTTGLLFARFSRPTSRILFSKNALIATHEGKPTLMFRLANERSNRVVQASVRVSLLRFTTTLEGQSLRRLIDLKLTRSDSAMFAITWTVFHVIDESSPLFGATRESLDAEKAALVVTMIGIDDTLSQTVHARHAWNASEILFDRRFVDVITENADGSRTLDLTKFHDTVSA